MASSPREIKNLVRAIRKMHDSAALDTPTALTTPALVRTDSEFLVRLIEVHLLKVETILKGY